MNTKKQLEGRWGMEKVESSEISEAAEKVL